MPVQSGGDSVTLYRQRFLDTRPMSNPASFIYPDAVRRVIDVLESRQHPHRPVMLDAAARTAQQAADALGVALGQIAKSIVFRRKPDEVAVMVVTSGDRRVHEGRVAELVCGAGSTLGRADAEFVKSRTGFSIGGVAPLAHRATPGAARRGADCPGSGPAVFDGTCVTLIDRDLFRFDEIWAAAGHPHAVFRLTPSQLLQLTGAPAADVVEPVSSSSAPTP